MYKILLAIALLLTSGVYAQDTTGSTRLRSEDTSAINRRLNSVQHFMDSVKQAEADRDAERNVNNILSYQNEQRAKQKKQAYLYIGIGIFFLIILVVGLMRKRGVKK